MIRLTARLSFRLSAQWFTGQSVQFTLRDARGQTSTPALVYTRTFTYTFAAPPNASQLACQPTRPPANTIKRMIPIDGA